MFCCWAWKLSSWIDERDGDKRGSESLHSIQDDTFNLGGKIVESNISNNFAEQVERTAYDKAIDHSGLVYGLVEQVVIVVVWGQVDTVAEHDDSSSTLQVDRLG